MLTILDEELSGLKKAVEEKGGGILGVSGDQGFTFFQAEGKKYYY